MAAPASSSERLVDTPVFVDPQGKRARIRRSASRPDGNAFRPDIQMLRALAVLAVVLFHLWPNRLTGGYVGVDVFFVISGFLITSHLIREIDASGRIAVGRFWARRAKRLLPAALLVLGLTAATAILVMPPPALAQTLREVVASVFYVENWALAQNSVDYMAADNIASPVQHFWTLSVEEQFYIALPLIMMLIAAGARMLRFSLVRSIMIGLTALTVLSFVYSVWLTTWSESTAYFSTATRLWEFGVGGLVGMAPALRRRGLATLVTAAGLAMIIVAIASYGPDTPFPGYAAALPVLGTALVLYAGAATFATKIGSLRPIAVVGGISYAVYLWHWPPIVLLPYITGHPLTTVEKLAILAATLVAAWLSTRFWEDRIRFSPRLLGQARPLTVALVVGLGMIIVAAVPVVVLVNEARQAEERGALVAEITSQNLPCFGAGAMVDTECSDPSLDGVLLPAPEDAPDDLEPRPDCWSNGPDATLNVCTIGDAEDYERRLLVVGDSHAKALLSALEVIAAERGWRIDLASRASCYWTDHDLRQKSQELTDACEQWRSNLGEYIGTQDDLDAIVAVKARRSLADEIDMANPAAAMSAVVDGMASAWDARSSTSVPVIALVDNPRMPPSTVDCVVREHLRAAEECALPASEVLPPDGVREAAAIAENAHVVDLTRLYCDDLCRPVIGNAVVYRDGRHLTDTYVRTIAPYLADEIEAVLDE
ncbi:acyltransferase family protein [Microbacterium sp. CFBP9034]|uniref:acyltransferase family protein n=1 Tax=Microbacterium sp. CFBP9034 TaxID=3096540 RepID=UPI002A698F24|nr:acyltransferase family protein [Microbacterium sp. CFBP9034]MDY0908999.1 acyltransferase family protein [Microbacterium sp. CFBP9034]